MRQRIGLGALVVLGLSAVVSARGEEEKVALDRVPQAIMAAVKAKFPNAEIKGAEKEVEKGKTVYEINLKDAGHNVDVSFKEDGTLLSVEKEVDFKNFPKAVSDAVKAKYPSGTVKKAEEITEGDKVKYEVIITIEGKKSREVVLDPQGKILEDQSEDEG